MTKILAVDPGLRFCGVAVGEEGRLIACALVESPQKTGRGGTAWGAMARSVKAWADTYGEFDRVRCETPMQYMPGNTAGKRIDPDDLMQIQGVVGALCAFYTVETIYPYQWKGQLPKLVGYNRVISKLDDTEKSLLNGAKCAESKRHNIGDAVGIFLNAVGRFK